jgi:phenylalanyl-tRNA synthetase alpha chain
MNAAEIESIKTEALAQIESAGTNQELEDIRIKYLGRKGLLPQIMKSLKDVAPQDRAAVGQGANALKNELNAALKAKLNNIGSGSKIKAGKFKAPFDSTLPGNWPHTGAVHPISQVIEEAVRILSRIGFTVAEGPDVETGYRNFEALNTPDYHPSLDQQDTLWLDSGELLRTQTSPVQIRVMEKQPPPVRIITPGRCYRRDTTDATHSANFHQIEGLYVDKDVSLADLKGTVLYFAQQMMGAYVKVRSRPHFFPFTEPSVEFDFSCHVCHGKGCRVCKNSGWIEIAGAGMVDPRVFERVGYNPEEVSGFAFGMGIERIAMIKYGIPDIRMLYDNDARFLTQFR